MIQRLSRHGIIPERGTPGRELPLFASRSSLRKLRVLIDVDVLESLKTTSITSDLILAGLLTHPLVTFYRYADEGPPPKIKAREYGDWAKAYEGWATVELPEPKMGVRAVTYADDTVTHTGIMGDIIEMAREDNRTNVYSELGPDGAALRREADAVASQVASSIGADIFITNRPFLHQGHAAYTRNITVLTPSSALPLVSLYLRAQGDFLTFRSPDGGGTAKMNRGLFYWVGTRELLPSAWRWFKACVMESHATSDDTLIYLGQSALQRVQRALMARDTVHCMVNQPQNNDIADDILSNLDTTFVLLMGALDAVARVAHISLGFSQSRNRLRSAGWQNSQWLDQVREEAESLAAIVADDSPGQRVLTILRAFRNSVHGEALQPLAVQQSGQRLETLFGLPRSDMDELLVACEALGGLSQWGVKQQIPGRMHADPHVLLEELFPRVISLLDSLMTHTPVERLPHIDATTLSSGPPDEGPMGTFSEKNRNSIRWQLGF